jgi:predicted nuclease of predicted toxin-antitoxin system
MGWVDVESLMLANLPSAREVRQGLEYLRRHAKLRIYTDEGFPPLAVGLLRGMGARVQTTEEAGRRGRSDDDQAAFALKHGFVILTRDRDYLNERRFPLVHCPAVVVCDLGSGSRQELRKTFVCLKTAFALPQFYDRWIKIDARPDSWIEYARFLDGTTSRTRHRVYRGRLQEWTE